jgi:hypothetical protein
MKTRFALAGTLGVLFLLLAIVPGCKKTVEPVKIAEWDRYADPVYKLSFNHPKGWTMMSDPGRIKFYSSAEAAEKFFDPTSKKQEGVELIVSRDKAETLPTLDDYMASYKKDLTASGFRIAAEEAKKLDGVDAKSITYSGAYAADAKVKTTRVVTIKDSMIFFVQYSAFNDLYDPYKAVFDTVMASFRLPKPKTAEELANPAKPSDEFTTFDNFAVKISHPDNFDAATPKPKAPSTFSLELKGYRQDCSIRIDILPAKGLTVEKVFEQNQKFFKAYGKGESKIDGLKALYCTYSPAKSIESRAYFVVKNDKVIRSILNYYQPMKADFLPAFERSIGSLKIK